MPIRRNATRNINSRPLRIETLEDRRMLAVTVDTLADVVANDGFTSLREAIATTNSTGEDTIDFSVTGTITLTGGELAITDSLNIHGPGQDLITIDADLRSRVLNYSATSGDLTINGITLSRGTLSGETGAGILFSSNGALTLTGSTVSDNRITGISFDTGAGAGIASAVGNVFLTDSTISNNVISVESSNMSGAGIYTGAGNVTLRNSTVAGNDLSGSLDGSGIFSYSGNTSLINSTVTGNSNGAIVTRTGNISVISSTISDNSGLGIFVPNSSGAPSLTIESSIVADNSGSGLGEDILISNAASVLTINHSLIGVADGLTINGNVGNLTGTAASPLNPILGPLGDNGGPTETMELAVLSPAVDAGMSTEMFDQRGVGFPRRQGIGVDMGAFEAAAPALHVNSTGNIDDGDIFNGVTTLREAIAQANLLPGEDVITFSELFDSEQTISTFSEFEITDSLSIVGPGQDLLTIDGQQNSRVIHYSGETGDLSISGLTLANGRIQGGGAGAGIMFRSTGALTLERSAVENNRISGVNDASAFGGGIAAGTGSVFLIESAVAGNRLSTESGIASGAGVYASSGTVTVDRSTLSNNVVNNGLSGGGIGTSNGDVVVMSSTISNNSGAVRGGGIYTASGEVTLVDSTISKNAAAFGGGIFVNGIGSSPAMTINNSIVADNGLFGGVDLSPAANGLLTINYSLIGTADELSITGDVGNLIGTTVSPIDPMLGPLQDNGGPTKTMALLEISPAVNAGSSAEAFDQRGVGFPRRLDGRVDMGAFELDIEASPLRVNSTGDTDDGDIFNETTTLREAINYANSLPGVNAITFSSLFETPQTISFLPANGELRITDSLIITGPGQNLLTINAQNNSRVLNFSSTTGDLTLEGLTLTGGRQTYGRGGGIRFNSDGDLTLTSSTVQFSRATGYNGFGGGIYSGAGDVFLTESTVKGNDSNTEGGGIYTDSGNLTLVRSTVSGNDSELRGGGIFVNTGEVSITNSTISGNRTDDLSSFGGGIFSRSVDVSLLSSTVTQNSARAAGGGLFIYNSAVNPQLTIENSIIADNTANIREDLAPDTDGTVTINYSLIGIADGLAITGNVGNFTGTSFNPLDPVLESLSSNGGPTETHALILGSPAIDNGTDSSLPNDQRGTNFLRKFGSQVDMGAFELQPEPEATADFDQDGDFDGTDFLTWQRNHGTSSGAILAEGDADRDGDVDNFDLVVWELDYQLNNLPTFSFTEAFFGGSDGTNNDDVDLGFLNDDEYLDAFVTGRSIGGPTRVWLNNGDGTFSSTGQTLGQGTHIFSALGDIDNDGDIDAVVAELSSEVVIYLNDGNGIFTNGGSVASATPLDVALEYLDGDDRLDLYIVQNDEPDIVYLNDPVLGFVNTGQSLGDARSRGVEFAHLNDDAFLDAFVAVAATSNSNLVFFNDGNGIFTDSGQTLGDGDSRHVALGDLDGDGHIDAFEANVGANRVWLNDGNGVFTDTGQALGDNISSHAVLGDLDLDGDLDAFVANFSQTEPDQLWLNNGSGIFTPFDQVFVNNRSSHAALGDLDLDGDLDVIIAAWSLSAPNRIWLNNIISPPPASLAPAAASFSSSPIGRIEPNAESSADQALADGGNLYIQLPEFFLDDDFDPHATNWFDQLDRTWLNTENDNSDVLDTALAEFADDEVGTL